MEKDIHVLPLGDLHEHDESRACWCQPRVDQYTVVAIVIHHAADARELVEEHGVN